MLALSVQNFSNQPAIPVHFINSVENFFVSEDGIEYKLSTHIIIPEPANFSAAVEAMIAQTCREQGALWVSSVLRNSQNAGFLKALNSDIEVTLEAQRKAVEADVCRRITEIVREYKDKGYFVGTGDVIISEIV